MKPGPKQRRPDRETLRRIVCEEADRARLGESALWDLRRWPGAVKATRRAMIRAIEETGCSAAGLAAVWGCDAPAVRRAIQKARAPTPTPPPKPLYDERTLARLTWQHGEARAARIAAGQDFPTNIDLAAWRSLGSDRGEAA